MHQRLGPLLRGVSLASALLSSIALLCSTAFADDAGYIDNWPGRVQIEVQTPGAAAGDPPVVTVLPDALAPAPLSEQFRVAWTAQRERVCGEIRAAMVEQGVVSKWLACNLTEQGELRGRILNPSTFPNRLDLKYIVKGNRIRFEAPTDSIFGSWFDPLIRAEFDLVLQLTLIFDRTIDGRRLPSGFETQPVPP
ncbi:MAG TPA: hypothetical protein VM925_21665, partial [Labilithrix sp.]|nr:hypothetical protein [Labilithrix sp.]